MLKKNQKFILFFSLENLLFSEQLNIFLLKILGAVGGQSASPLLLSTVHPQLLLHCK
jgi:hypothetical protein